MSYENPIGGPPEEVYHISVSADSPVIIGSPEIGQGGSGQRANSIYERKVSPDGLAYLKKINSNVKHKPYKPKKVDNNLYYKDWEKKTRNWSYDKTDHPIHYVYLLERFKGLEYSLNSYNNLDENMPFYKQNPQLTQASKNYIQTVSYYANRSAYYCELWRKRDGDYDYSEIHINTRYSRWSQVRADIPINIQEFILSFARSALKAGVPCQTILNDIKQNMSLTGLDDDVFLSACREEKGIELGRMYHSKTEESICCIDVEMQPDKFRKQGESFEDYFSRFKNTIQWGNLSLTYDFL